MSGRVAQRGSSVERVETEPTGRVEPKSVKLRIVLAAATVPNAPCPPPSNSLHRGTRIHDRNAIYWGRARLNYTGFAKQWENPAAVTRFR